MQTVNDDKIEFMQLKLNANEAKLVDMLGRVALLEKQHANCTEEVNRLRRELERIGK
jgi:hypothetical protein